MSESGERRQVWQVPGGLIIEPIDASHSAGTEGSSRTAQATGEPDMSWFKPKRRKNLFG
jgi:hypothetical protein